jgi:hypothetical protein
MPPPAPVSDCARLPGPPPPLLPLAPPELCCWPWRCMATTESAHARSSRGQVVAPAAWAAGAVPFTSFSPYAPRLRLCLGKCLVRCPGVSRRGLWWGGCFVLYRAGAPTARGSVLLHPIDDLTAVLNASTLDFRPIVRRLKNLPRAHASILYCIFT